MLLDKTKHPNTCYFRKLPSSRTFIHHNANVVFILAYIQNIV